MKSDAPTEAASRADFSQVRYAQVWEDADILTEALNTGEGKTLLSIASAGDNALALLTLNPAKVYAIDLNPAQLNCLALRVAAFKCLEYGEILELLGARPSSRRQPLYNACRKILDAKAKAFWDRHLPQVDRGIGTAGKFERYFETFRTRVLPLVHNRRTIAALLENKTPDARKSFYQTQWNNLRWRWLFHIFFSRFMMGRLGRDPAFFKYVEGSVAAKILNRTRYALTELNPAENPYLQWILNGEFGNALPLYLREEYFDIIRSNLDKLEWRLASIEEFADRMSQPEIDGCNLSDIFEYMSEDNTRHLLAELCRISRPGARFAYWNMLAPRSRPESLTNQLRPMSELAEALFKKDKAFFYSRFVIEEVQK